MPSDARLNYLSVMNGGLIWILRQVTQNHAEASAACRQYKLTTLARIYPSGYSEVLKVIKEYEWPALNHDANGKSKKFDQIIVQVK